MNLQINLKSIIHLTDKDYQLVSKTFRKVAELFYQNSNNLEYVQSLTCLVKMIPQIVSSKFTQGLTITSQMEILKAKVKGNTQLKKLLQVAIEHLKYPKFIPINTELIIEALSRVQLFVFGCTIALRSFQILKQDRELDWKKIVDSIGLNIDQSPHLAVQLMNQMCRENEQNTKLITKSGVVMYIFVDYLKSNFKDLFNLYRGIKLIKSISQVDRSVVRERQKILALLIFKENYQLIMSDICSKCYDGQYCSTITKRNIYELGGIDFPYLWSYVELFCKNQLNEEIISNYIKILKAKISSQMQSKIYAICSNYCKYAKFVSKQLLKITPKYQQSLWNFLKMCYNISQIDAVAPHYIVWKELDELIQSKSDAKVVDLANYLRNLMNQPARVGSLSSKSLQVFSINHNTDILLDRARKVPKNNDQLPNLRMILSEKSNTNQQENDKLMITKEKALQSLRKAITNRVRLDLNSVVETIQTGDIGLITSFLQILQIYLTMFEQAQENLNKKKIFELIAWIQDHYNGEIIDWGSIREVLKMICSQKEWKKHIKQLNQHCFWILSIDSLENSDQNQIWKQVQIMSIQQLAKKLPFVIGFLGKIYYNSQRATCLEKKAKYLEMLVNNVAKNRDYNVNIMMIAYYLRGWGQQQEDYEPIKYTKKFEEFIHPLVNIITNHPRQTPQQNYFLQCCLPFKFNTNKLSTDLESLIKSNGKLASKAYQQLIKTGKKQNNIKMDNLTQGPIEQVHNSMIFASNFPSSINTNSVITLVDTIKSNPNSYWQLFPRYVDIMANTISVVGESQGEPIVEDLSKIAETLFGQINQNQDIVDDERLQLLEQMRNAFQNLKERRVYIEIERIKKVVTRIVETEIREEILIILNDYKIDETKKVQPNIKQPLAKNVVADLKKQQEIKTKKVQVIMTESKLVEQSPKKEESRQIKIQRAAEQNMQKKQTEQQMLQSLILRNNVGLAEAFKTLKKIINREIVPQIFKEIYPIFVENTLTQNEKELLGGQLAQLYNISNCQKALSLLIDSNKTRLNSEQILELVSKHIPAFALKKRQKLISKLYIDIAMQRVKQQFLADGCEVATYNLNQTDHLEYFYSKKHHKTILQLVSMVNLQDEIVQLLQLIGKAARLPQIRSEWIDVSLHTKIMAFINKFPKSIKIIPSLNFALSSLTFEENKACSDVIKKSDQMYLILQAILIEPGNQQVAQYASLFIFNLCFSRCFETYPAFNVSKVIIVLKKLFKANLQSDNLSPYSYILKAIGQLSINQKFCAEILDSQFCDNVNRFSEKVDILTGYDEKKGEYVKMMIDMIFSLSKNKQSLMILHKHKITLLIATLLEAIQTKYAELIGSCIDTINALCQDPIIQLWFVNQKRLPYILMDILKLQSEEQLVLKSMRMITNLTLKNTNIPYILKSNILGVIANIVIPHLGIYRVASENQQFTHKVEAYIVKIITRIFEVKPELEQILKSGFLDCIVRMIEMVQAEQKFLDIFFHYSPHIPNFLNKRAFSSLIKILIIKINDKNALVKCIQSFRNVLSFTYQGDEDNNPIEGLSEMYLKVFQTEFVADGLFLLGYHLFRSNKFREQLKLPGDKIQKALALLSEQQLYKQFCRSISFLIYNPPVNLWLQDTDSQISGKQYDIMRKGIDCYLYRSDGTHKEAKIDIDEEYNFRVYKAPDGEIKKKYTSNVRYIREFQIEYQNHEELWNKSLFVMQKGIFHMAKPQNCCTLVSNSKWGEINLINIQFYKQETKLIFYMCLSHILAIFRL